MSLFRLNYLRLDSEKLTVKLTTGLKIAAPPNAIID